jgi:dGTPase
MTAGEVRQRLEEREEALSSHATRSFLSRRLRPEPPDPLRTAFQRDRDRILHSKAFRRLKHKTQVFINPEGDHFVTRLTHTLEVAQIARTIARALNLNEDLAEAIALGHDLGHTPFGHIGEEVLNQLYPNGFHHSVQSLRVVDVLENEGQGLNLTHEVRDGILHHSKAGFDAGGPATLEGQVVKLSDAIAYINHDTADAIRAGLLQEEDLPAQVLAVLGRTTRERINILIADAVSFSWSATGLAAEKTPVIGLSPRVKEAAEALRDFLFERVYNQLAELEEARKAKEVVRLLYSHYLHHPDELPPECHNGDELATRVVDYIAGMTDRFALRLAEEVAQASLP